MLVALTFGTGVIDVASYLGLGQIFTANMTGNTIFLAIAIGRGNVVTGARSAMALAMFGTGAFLGGRYLGTAPAGASWTSRVTWTLWVETGFLAVFSVLWLIVGWQAGGLAVLALISVCSVGMGLQSSAGRNLAVPGMTTNVLTMAFTGLMAELTALGVSGSHARKWAAVILSMASGAVLGAWLFVHDPQILPFPTLLILLGVCILASRFGTDDAGVPSVPHGSP